MAPDGGAFDTAQDARSEPSADRHEALVDRLHQGPGPDAQKQVALTPTGPPPSRWTLRTIRASVDWLHEYTLSGVWRVLARHKLSVRSARVQLYSPDPAYADKLQQLLGCLRAAALAPEQMVALFLDEMGYYTWPAPATDWTLNAPAAAPVAQRSDCNNQQWRIIGALNALTGQVDYLSNYIVGRQQLIKFYAHLHQSYAWAQRVYLVQDNWSVHQHPDVLKALEQWPRLTPVWLPTYAPWLNPIEKLWRWLRQDVLKMHRLAADPKQLRERVHAFLDQFASGKQELLRYVGLLGTGTLAGAIRSP